MTGPTGQTSPTGLTSLTGQTALKDGRRRCGLRRAEEAAAVRQMSTEQAELWFNMEVRRLIPPRNQSDRTSFRRVGRWVSGKVSRGEAEMDMFNVVLALAREAAGPRSRNPAAVFMTLMKQEMGYGCSHSE
ncbi:MAG TPA: hypothetical protein VMW16_07985 [Sedimentisphaerales bacterium]|nr:hypothetical protein [Sedimentisphaerales bacterium]